MTNVISLLITLNCLVLLDHQESIFLRDGLHIFRLASSLAQLRQSCSHPGEQLLGGDVVPKDSDEEARFPVCYSQ